MKEDIDFIIFEKEGEPNFTIESISTEKENTILNSHTLSDAMTNTLDSVLDPMFSLLWSVMGMFMVIVVLKVSLEVFVHFLRHMNNHSTSNTSVDKNYEETTYTQVKQVIQLFTSYKQFQRSARWFVYKNRKKHLKEISTIFFLIDESKYKENVHYQYEIIQLFPQMKQLVKLLEENRSSEISNKIKQLNKNFWSVDF